MSGITKNILLWPINGGCRRRATPHLPEVEVQSDTLDLIEVSQRKTDKEPCSQ